MAVKTPFFGLVELRFLRPVPPDDTVTLTGAVTGITKVTNGERVAVQVSATNQKGDTTAAGDRRSHRSQPVRAPEE